jgi:para-nitrobenzyl esterase
MQVISEDHLTVDVSYDSGPHTYTTARVATRYAFVIVRVLVDPKDPQDLQQAHRLQDRIEIEQASAGRFEIPRWDPASQAKARNALSALGSLGSIRDAFGSRDEVDPIDHLVGTATGWGGNPRSAAVYMDNHPKRNDGSTVHTLTVKDVPVDGFWSISVYDAKGYFARNVLNAYSLNSLTAKPSADGSYSIRFGACGNGLPNCLPITPGWNYTVRLYRPRPEIVDGTWIFPAAQPVH